MNRETRNGENSVTVVIPVYNRSDQLINLLNSLQNMYAPPNWYEILICDDGSTENIQQLVESIHEINGVPLRYLRQTQQGPAAARNLGLFNVKTELVAFTDSDCAVSEDWLNCLVQVFTDHPEVGVAGGPVSHHPDSTLAAQCSNWIMSTSWGGGARNPKSIAAMTYFPRGTNMAARTELARKSGGFPDNRYGEDVGFSHRVMQLGTTSYFSERAAVYHVEMRSLIQIYFEAFRKGKARIQLYHSGNKAEVIHFAPAFLVAYFISLLFLPFLQTYTAGIWLIPAIIYLSFLGIITIQGALTIKPAAFAVAPCCAFLMHFGYGTGLWKELIWRALGAPTIHTVQISNPAAGSTNSKT